MPLTNWLSWLLDLFSQLPTWTEGQKLTVLVSQHQVRFLALVCCVTATQPNDWSTWSMLSLERWHQWLMAMAMREVTLHKLWRLLLYHHDCTNLCPQLSVCEWKTRRSYHSFWSPRRLAFNECMLRPWHGDGNTYCYYQVLFFVSSEFDWCQSNWVCDVLNKFAAKQRSWG